MSAGAWYIVIDGRTQSHLGRGNGRGFATKIAAVREAERVRELHGFRPAQVEIRQAKATTKAGTVGTARPKVAKIVRRKPAKVRR